MNIEEFNQYVTEQSNIKQIYIDRITEQLSKKNATRKKQT